jgi:hypothetical protein
MKTKGCSFESQASGPLESRSYSNSTPTFFVHSFSHAAFCFAVAALGGAACAPVQIRQTERIKAVNTADLALKSGKFMVSRSLEFSGITVSIKPGLPDVSAPHGVHGLRDRRANSAGIFASVGLT